MKQAFILLLILLLSNTMCAQKHGKQRVDSLLNELQITKQDTTKVNILNQLAFLVSSNNPDQGIEYADSALSLARQAKWQKGIANSYYHKSLGQKYNSDFSLAFNTCDTALKLFEKANDKIMSAAAHNNIGSIYSSIGKTREAIEHHDKALKIQDEIGDVNGKSVTYNNIGNVYYRSGRYPEALSNLQQSLEIKKRGTDKRGQANTLNSIGAVYQKLGDAPEAMTYFLASLKIQEEIGDKRGVAAGYDNVGIVYWDQKNYQEALVYGLKALKIREEMGDRQGIATSYSNLGGTYSMSGNHDTAIAFFFKALKIQEVPGDTNYAGASMSYNNIGSEYYEKKDYPEALKNYTASLNIRKKIGDTDGMVLSYNNIGDIFLKRKQYDDAERYCDSSLLYAEKIGVLQGIADAHEALTEIYQATGKFEKALDHYTLSKNAQDSIYSISNIAKITKAQDQYYFDKKRDSLKYEADKKELELNTAMQINRLRYEYEKKRAAAKTEQEKQHLIAEQALKEQKIIFTNDQRQAELQKQQEIKTAVASENHKRELAVAAARMTRQRITYLVVGIAVLIGSIIGFNFYRERKLRIVRDQLTDLARAKIHNIKSKYNAIHLLLKRPGEQPVLRYVNESSKYLKALLHSWNKKQWTISEELSLMDTFYEAEAVIHKKVTFVKEFNGVNVDTVLFMQDVFTTILDNAISYGFRNKKDECIFRISIQKTGNVLLFEISDNGEGGELYKYMSPSNPDNGLNILNNRIINAFELRGVGRKKVTGIKILASKESGTTIKFTYPYAEIKGSYRRKYSWGFRVA